MHIRNACFPTQDKFELSSLLESQREGTKISEKHTQSYKSSYTRKALGTTKPRMLYGSQVEET